MTQRGDNQNTISRTRSKAHEHMTMLLERDFRIIHSHLKFHHASTTYAQQPSNTITPQYNNPSTSSATAKQLVNPGLSIPNRFTNPSYPSSFTI